MEFWEKRRPAWDPFFDWTDRIFTTFRRDSLHLSLIHEPEDEDAGNGTDGGEGTDDPSDEAAESQKANAKTAKKAAVAAKDRKVGSYTLQCLGGEFLTRLSPISVQRLVHLR